jgi:hypothetical protein
VAEATLLHVDETTVLNHAAKLLLSEPENKDSIIGFDAASVRTLRREFLLYGLIEIGREDRSYYHPLDKSTVTQTVTTWKLTDYGRRQLAAIAP